MRRRKWVLIAAAGTVATVSAWRLGSVVSAGTAEQSTAEALQTEGLTVDPGNIHWVGPAGGLVPTRPAIVLARKGDGPADLYYAEVEVTEGGTVLAVHGLTNISDTVGADETELREVDGTLAFASKVSAGYDSIVVLDPRGEPPELTVGWSTLARWQNAITNIQDTGRSEGMGRWVVRLDPPSETLELLVAGGRLVAQTSTGTVQIDVRARQVVEGAEHVSVEPQYRSQPGNIAWAVDTVRRVSWVGAGPIEWFEHQVFSVTDWAKRTWHGVFGSDTEAEVADDMAAVGNVSAERRAQLSVTRPDLGWPPASLTPLLRPPIRNEGEWIPAVDDPFVRSYPNAPPAFYQTFLRADGERAFTRVYIVIFDPRQVQLHIMTGTREPESATGATSPGIVPRDPETLGRIVAGFNGGFQALHGEFGAMVDRRVYIPPKPWAATVAVHDDGRVSMGSWLPPPPRARAENLAEWATAQIPAHMVSLRQNLTSVVEGDRYNPWGRWWWGAAPSFASEQTFIDRSGLCLTSEGFLAYFWGESMGAEALGNVMLATRCVRGLHLDMNSVHTGFEFYNVRPASESFAALGRELTDDEYDGELRDADGFVLRARKAVRSMRQMRFPRWVHREPRDFFFLTLKPVLPGPDLPGAPPRGAGQEAEAAYVPGRFYETGLPNAGWPPAFARATAPGGHSWLVRIDPTRAIPEPVPLPPAAFGMPDGWQPTAPGAGSAAPDAGAQAADPGPSQAEPTVLGYFTAPEGDGTSGDAVLYAERGPLGSRYGVGEPAARRLVVARGLLLTAENAPVAAIGVDGDGFLVYAERAEGDPTPLAEHLTAAGVSRAVALQAGVRLVFVADGRVFAADATECDANLDGATALRANPAPAAEILFPGVLPRPYNVWAGMQDTRVRYVREGEARFKLLPGGVVVDRARDAAQGPL